MLAPSRGPGGTPMRNPDIFSFGGVLKNRGPSPKKETRWFFPLGFTENTPLPPKKNKMKKKKKKRRFFFFPLGFPQKENTNPKGYPEERFSIFETQWFWCPFGCKGEPQTLVDLPPAASTLHAALFESKATSFFAGKHTRTHPLL